MTTIHGLPSDAAAPARAENGALWCPFDLTLEPIASFLNCELADHPDYTGLELQWFDDPDHGTGMLAFLERRSDRRVDYYLDPGLRLDRANYGIAGGIGAWVPTEFDEARLEVTAGGVVADVRFRAKDGRTVEIVVDDRSAGPRRPAELLAPFGATIERPSSLLLVYLHGFDLLRRTDHEPRIRIGGTDVRIGRLPGAGLHGRHLVKAAGPLTTVSLCPARVGPVDVVEPGRTGPVRVSADGDGVAGVARRNGQMSAELTFDPALPRLGDLPDDVPRTGAWSVEIDGRRVTGGIWRALRHGARVDLELAVTRRWRPPPRQPWLVRLVTRLVPTFRRWPTTYRWRCQVLLDGTPRMAAGWERVGHRSDATYRRVTGS